LALGLSTDPVDPAQLEAALSHSYRGIKAEPGLGQRLVDAVQQVLGYLLRLFFAALERIGGAGSLVQWLAATALSFLILWLAWKIFRRIGLVKETSRGEGSQRAPTIDWRADAEAALARGDLLQAVRAYYRQLVQSLAAKGWVSDRPGVTSGECRRAVKNLPISSEVERATRVFEAVVYGRRSPRGEDVEALRSAEALVSGARL
jgi:uncharacterized protein DUF4129